MNDPHFILFTFYFQAPIANTILFKNWIIVANKHVSIYEYKKAGKRNVLQLFILYVVYFYLTNFDYPADPLKYQHSYKKNG